MPQVERSGKYHSDDRVSGRESGGLLGTYQSHKNAYEGSSKTPFSRNVNLTAVQVYDAGSNYKTTHIGAVNFYSVRKPGLLIGKIDECCSE